MFRATMCPSSGETTLSVQHLVLVILYGLLSGIQSGTKLSLAGGRLLLFILWAAGNQFRPPPNVGRALASFFWGATPQDGRFRFRFPIGFLEYFVLLTVHPCICSILYNRQPTTQNNKQQVSHEYCCFSWWWAHCCPKRGEKRNNNNVFINCNWVVTRWQCLFYMCTKHEFGY